MQLRDNILNLKSKVVLAKKILINRDILRKNYKYSNLYKGKRCFIIGNGPSLKNLNLQYLKDEYTLTVNKLIDTELFEVLKPTFHIIIDSNWFNKENQTLFSIIKKIPDLRKNTKFVFPLKHFELLEKENIYNDNDIIFQADTTPKKVKNIDFTKAIPANRNVINVAFSLAIYLGFEKIFFIGCDMTNFLNEYNEEKLVLEDRHFYSEKMLKDTNYQILSDRKNELILKAYGETFELLRLNYDYAQNLGIQVYNATGQGTLDVFPYANFNKIFNE